MNDGVNSGILLEFHVFLTIVSMAERHDNQASGKDVRQVLLRIDKTLGICRNALEIERGRIS